MNKKRDKMSRAVSHLDDELIRAAMDESDMRGEAYVAKERKNSMKQHGYWKKWASIAAVFAIILCAGVLIWQMSDSGANTTIALDVNPSMEIEINTKEEIVEVRALNADAEIVLGDMDLRGVDLELGMNAIVGAMLRHGYLSADQNSILVSIDSESTSDAAALQEKLSGKISTLLAESKIEASVITQSFQREAAGDLAERNDISPAKAELITKIVKAGLLDANGVPYAYETLAKLRVHELKLILDSKAQTIGGVNTDGTASHGRYITYERAEEIALAQAGITAADARQIEIEMDYDDDHGMMVYEVEFRYGEKEYEYEIGAATEAILEEKSKPIDRNEDDEDVALPKDAVTREAALLIAYKDAGVEAADARRPEIEVDREAGIVVYEIEFKAGGMEHEYVINAVTGEILAREVEPID